MSRSLGLREDQRWKDELMTRIIGYLPVEPSCRHRWQASSHGVCGGSVVGVITDSIVGAGLPAMRPEQAPEN
jgi:hypothetical protein